MKQGFSAVLFAAGCQVYDHRGGLRSVHQQGPGDGEGWKIQGGREVNADQWEAETPTVVSFHIIDAITFKQKDENSMFVHVDSSRW